MRHLIIACSLSATSKSAQLAELLQEAGQTLGDEVELIDLRQVELPFCDAAGCYEHQNVGLLRQKIAAADAVTLAVPIYNFETGGATRNLLALTGKAWMGKIVGVVAAAGGERSYMSIMPLAGSLMLDFRCLVLPKYVYASKIAFSEAGQPTTEIRERVEELAGELNRVATALNNAPAPADA
jgi:NAD(P)H-dependent FMN reductase